MLELNEPDHIPTFATLEVIFHLKPLIMPARVDYFHPTGTLLTWRCAKTGSESPKARQLLLYNLEHKEWTALASYMMSSTPKELPLTFHASPAWI